MISPAEIASPIEIAALWRLNFLSADDISAVCLRWLEEDLDGGDIDIAFFAGERKLSVFEIAPRFERVLIDIVGGSIGREEAILRALRLYLALALEGDLLEGVQEVILRFQDLSKDRLVYHPSRSKDHPDQDYAEQELGLEYIYGGFYAFDDIAHLTADKQEVARAELLQQLRNDVAVLEQHLTDRLKP